MATSAAISATMVLPDPTSPCSSRFIGCGRFMSSTISRDDLLLIAGQLEWQHAPRRFADLVGDDDRPRLALGVRSRGAAAPARAGRGRTPRRSAAAAPAIGMHSASSMGVPAGGKCTSSSAVRRSIELLPRAHVRRQRIDDGRRAAAPAPGARSRAASWSSASRSSRRSGRSVRCAASRRRTRPRPSRRPPRLLQDLVLRILHLHPVRGQLEPAEQDHALMRMEDVVEKRLIEEDRAKRAGRDRGRAFRRS